MRLSKVMISYYRSVSDQHFATSPFTVLFGKNNAGKTNLLEAIYGILAPQEIPEGELPERGLRGHGDPDIATAGAIYVDLDPRFPFDNALLAQFPLVDPSKDGVLRSCGLPDNRVCCVSTDRGAEVWFLDVEKYFEEFESGWLVLRREQMGLYDDLDERLRSASEIRPRPLFLGWELHNFDDTVTASVAALPDRSPWWAPRGEWDDPLFNCIYRDSESGAWYVSSSVRERLDQLEALATSLLPDFIDGIFRVDLDVPQRWGQTPIVRVQFREQGDTEDRPVQDFGRGAFRWFAIAIQVALRIMDGDPDTRDLNQAPLGQFSGHVLFIDEPEAHLHPTAVSSVVRWCELLVQRGFNVVAASHHEEFLRATGKDLTFVEVSRGTERETRARSIAGTAAGLRQQLAEDIGLHPAVALSLKNAVVFVEGPLDVAVLDEYAGHAFDAAGVTLVPIHGTRNLEGLIDGEFTARLGIKTGILTDKTNTATIWDRSNRKRSSEEVKLVRLLRRYEEQNLLPPTPFGVAEDDLLFALPEHAIREQLGCPFPGWKELVEECREAEARGPQDSVDWKSYAWERYGLAINTPDGVRGLVHRLNSAGVELPAIHAVVDEIIAWAAEPEVGANFQT